MTSNFRRYLPCLLLLTLAAVPAVSVQAASDTEARLSQLERISNAHSQVLTELQQQVASNQADIDSLRGAIQEDQYQLNQVIERQKQILLQLDKLSNDITTGTTIAPASSPASGTNANSALPASSTNSGDEKSDYQAAVALVQDKTRINDAIAAFETFSKKYPKSKLQPNAGYWLGQLSYSSGKKDNALYYFAKVAKDYPGSVKAPESLYKVGIIMQEKGEKAQAKAVYSQVNRLYPGTESAKNAGKRLKTLQY